MPSKGLEMPDVPGKGMPLLRDILNQSQNSNDFSQKILDILQDCDTFRRAITSKRYTYEETIALLKEFREFLIECEHGQIKELASALSQYSATIFGDKQDELLTENGIESSRSSILKKTTNEFVVKVLEIFLYARQTSPTFKLVTLNPANTDAIVMSSILEFADTSIPETQKLLEKIDSIAKLIAKMIEGIFPDILKVTGKPIQALIYTGTKKVQQLTGGPQEKSGDIHRSIGLLNIALGK